MSQNLRSVVQIFREKIKGCQVLVIGDLMLDKYYFGDMKRISPEAPVPVVNMKEETKTLGGAANVANNLVHLGCQVSLAGIVGNDQGRDELLEMLEFKGVDVSGIFTDDRFTTTKTRIISGNQQVLRIDQEEQKEITDASLKQFEDWFSAKVNTKIYDAIIISDYGKGFCRKELCQFAIAFAKKKKIPIIIDPKGNDWGKYAEATMITPNLKELGDLLRKDLPNHDQIIHAYGPMLRNKYVLEYLLITRSEQGMSLIGAEEMFHIPTLAKEVFDVSGAGDTVISTLAALIGIGIPIHDAVRVANIAAGIVVGKVGTYAVHGDDLIEELEILNEEKNKIYFGKKYQSVINKWKSKGHSIIFTNGCFDLLHIGHATYLQNAKKMGDKLIIGLNSDESVKRLKGASRPIVHEHDRAKMLSFFEFIDAVIVFDEDTPENLIAEIRPDVLVKGGDYQAEAVLGKEYAGRVEILPFVDGYSTTTIIEKITN
ncbi:D-glycero-beta-D-manno-heptose-7-phosphate kinase [Robertmurraya kyonggiensis]|uniref:Bifunctional protein HldE n=1 Tax=Robertmurraya kyonggiensis TaxID=1037680 RepID=A0A4U1CZT5_9BACI|nr:D-glycero-beta-D-manno-heptose-7-phosphate kinase [Robertmurraya kyonggiensis]TKC15509.1 D-glycero-beta-D-manno-heptose-7-phosphate kinase [Robertmurraya kyonggiensis]